VVATVTVNLPGKSDGKLPARYLGLSFESGSAVNSGSFNAAGNLPRLLENLGVGVLRFGGSSVDQTYTGASRTALAGLARLVRATGWHVIYSVNLGHFNAGRVASDARAAAGALGGYLTAIACGNEPNDYAQQGIRSSSYTESAYLRESRACSYAVRTGAPAARISGPDTSHVDWLPSYALAEKGAISLLAEHYYPLVHGPDGTAAMLLSRVTAAAEASTIGAAAAAALTAGVPLRITETNSANGGGIKGVSNTFAAALWTVDYLLIGAERGAAGMNFHGSLTDSCSGYTVLCQVSTNRYAAQPVYYGLLFTHLMGTGSLLRVSVRSASDIAAHAVRTADGTLRIIIENLTSAAETISLRAGRVSGRATVLHLTGPSLSATSGVRIQGAKVQPNGTFTPGTASTLACQSGACSVPVGAYSAVIVTLPAHGGASLGALVAGLVIAAGCAVLAARYYRRRKARRLLTDVSARETSGESR
jgi:hypothetical protein